MVVQWSSPQLTSPEGAATLRKRTFRRFHVASAWAIPPGPVGSGVVQPGRRALDHPGPPPTCSPSNIRVGRHNRCYVYERITPERCAIDAQDDSASIGRVRAGLRCMQSGLDWVGRRPGYSYVST